MSPKKAATSQAESTVGVPPHPLPGPTQVLGCPRVPPPPSHPRSTCGTDYLGTGSIAQRPRAGVHSVFLERVATWPSASLGRMPTLCPPVEHPHGRTPMLCPRSPAPRGRGLPRCPLPVRIIFLEVKVVIGESLTLSSHPLSPTGGQLFYRKFRKQAFSSIKGR